MADGRAKAASRWTSGPPVEEDLLAEIRAVLAGLGDLLPALRAFEIHDFATAGAALAGAGRVIDSASASPAEGLGDLLVGVRALHGLSDRLAAIHLAHTRSSTQVLARVLPRLEGMQCSVPELVGVVPELICELGFDRALVSRVEDDVWYPEVLFATNDQAAAEKLTQLGRDMAQPLEPGLYETELVRSRRPMLVLGVQDAASRGWTHPVLVEGTRVRSYVATPILSAGEVVGMLHADRYGQRREVDEVDLDLLAAFAEAFRIALSRAELNDQMLGTQAGLRLLNHAMAAATVSAHQMPAIRAERDPGEADTGLVVRTQRRSAIPEPLPESLTPRELDVLRLLADGRTNIAIARQLSITDNTVKQHVTHILRKLGAGNRSEAVARWFQSAVVHRPGG
ncbi:MAG: LuxR C-terminal-related transcriptional regulator [Sporichthyaceae bacterium]